MVPDAVDRRAVPGTRRQGGHGVSTSTGTAGARVTGAAHALPPADGPAGAVGRLLPGALRRRPGRPHGLAAAPASRTRRGVVDPTQEDVSGWGTARADAALPRRGAAARQGGGRRAPSRDAGLAPTDVGLFGVVSCTGYVTPGLDILLARDLGMTADVQRLHIGHMGCYAALPGLGAVAGLHRRPAAARRCCCASSSRACTCSRAPTSARSGSPTVGRPAADGGARAVQRRGRGRRARAGRGRRARGRRRRGPHRRAAPPTT